MQPQPSEDSDRIRASDRERDQAIETLGQAAAEGRLTLEEYADRAGAAYAARTRGELARLTDDLPAPVPTGATAPVPAPARPLPAEPAERLVAIFSNETRKGSWDVPGYVVAKSIFGDCHIELQNARLRNPVTTIDATAIFGSITIFVPDGVEVRLSGMAVFGEKASHVPTASPPGAPVIEVRCRVWFGSVNVRTPSQWADRVSHWIEQATGLAIEARRERQAGYPATRWDAPPATRWDARAARWQARMARHQAREARRAARRGRRYGG